MTNAPSQASGATAFEAVLELIRNGVFTPGDRLREEDVSARLGLSRTPVREALRRLEAEGIVHHAPRVGAVIRQLERTEVVELYEMRIVLECTAAEMASQHGHEAEFDALETLNKHLADTKDDAQKSAQINRDFHRALYLAARNRFLLEAARGLNNALLILGPTTYSEPQRVEIAVREHAALIEALRGRSAPDARTAIGTHLRNSLSYRLAEVR